MRLIEWAAEIGVTTGYDDGTFKPQRPLSKRHAVVFMERYYDQILQADESEDFTRGDMMVLLKAINDGTLRGNTNTGVGAHSRPSAPASGHSCGLRTDNTITCWGDNIAETGRRARRRASKPSAAGGVHSCGLRTDNTITCWGGNHWAGQTDAPAGSLQSHHRRNLSYGCGLRTDNTITCWGNNSRQAGGRRPRAAS